MKEKPAIEEPPPREVNKPNYRTREELEWLVEKVKEGLVEIAEGRPGDDYSRYFAEFRRDLQLRIKGKKGKRRIFLGYTRGIDHIHFVVSHHYGGVEIEGRELPDKILEFKRKLLPTRLDRENARRYFTSLSKFKGNYISREKDSRKN